MNTEHHRWWQQSECELDEVLTFINASRACDDDIDRFDKLCKGLNKAANEFYKYRRKRSLLNDTERERGSSDNQSFQELFLRGLDSGQASQFCAAESLRRFAELGPQIMNHDTLKKEQYDPNAMDIDLRNKATEEHEKLLKAFRKFSASGDQQEAEQAKEALLKRAQVLLYVVRSNLAHGEKTPKGPDVNKWKRDRAVTETAAPVIEDFFDILFDGPSQRLAVYGTLKSDGPNASKLAGAIGKRSTGVVRGKLRERDGLKEFFWLHAGDSVDVEVLESPALGDLMADIDQFEGSSYQRVLAPVLIANTAAICNIYQGTCQDDDL